MHRWPLSFVTVCRLYGPITGLYISSFPMRAFTSPMTIFTAIELLLQLRVECLLIAIGCFFVWAVHVKDVVVEETASYPQPTHPIVSQSITQSRILPNTIKPVPSLLLAPPLWYMVNPKALSSHCFAPFQHISCSATTSTFRGLSSFAKANPSKRSDLQFPVPSFQSVSFSCVGLCRLFLVFNSSWFFAIFDVSVGSLIGAALPSLGVGLPP